MHVLIRFSANPYGFPNPSSVSGAVIREDITIVKVKPQLHINVLLCNNIDYPRLKPLIAIINCGFFAPTSYANWIRNTYQSHNFCDNSSPLDITKGNNFTRMQSEENNQDRHNVTFQEINWIAESVFVSLCAPHTQDYIWKRYIGKSF